MQLLEEKINSYFYEPSIAIWESEEFKVYAFQDGKAVRLDIERTDGLDGITWDELQRIKNDCGFSDCDAVEFYPSESDVINTGNLRHLYVFFEKLPLIRRL
jgi:hypothetical protein